MITDHVAQPLVGGALKVEQCEPVHFHGYNATCGAVQTAALLSPQSDSKLNFQVD